MSKSVGKSRLFDTSYCFLQYLYRGKDIDLQLILSINFIIKYEEVV